MVFIFFLIHLTCTSQKNTGFEVFWIFFTDRRTSDVTSHGLLYLNQIKCKKQKIDSDTLVYSKVLTQQPSLFFSQNLSKDSKRYYDGLPSYDNSFEDGCKIKCLEV